MGSFAATLPWACSPGNCTYYSSTNYVLLGFLLLRYAQEDSKDWTTLNLSEVLGRNATSGITFANTGPLNHSLTVAGESVAYGPVEIDRQDASILGWTCGNAIASGQAVAQFYYNLLGPSSSNLLNTSSIETMMNWTTVSKGWETGTLEYGAGLMIQNVSPNVSQSAPPPRDHVASYIGHGGFTYAFMSDNGFFPALNASMSVVINEDIDYQYPSFVITCPLLEVVARHAGLNVDLGCTPPVSRDLERYVCSKSFGQPVCIGTIGTHTNLTRAACDKTC